MNQPVTRDSAHSVSSSRRAESPGRKRSRSRSRSPKPKVDKGISPDAVTAMVPADEKVPIQVPCGSSGGVLKEGGFATVLCHPYSKYYTRGSILNGTAYYPEKAEPKELKVALQAYDKTNDTWVCLDGAGDMHLLPAAKLRPSFDTITDADRAEAVAMFGTVNKSGRYYIKDLDDARVDDELI